MKLRRLFLLSLICNGIIILASTELPGATVTLAWDPNPESDLAGYKVHYGETRGFYPDEVDVGNVVTATITNLREGVRYYFAVTAYNIAGLESDPSNELLHLTSSPLDLLPPLRIELSDRFADGRMRLKILSADGSPVDPLRLARLEIVTSTDPTLPVESWVKVSGYALLLDGVAQWSAPQPGLHTQCFFLLKQSLW